MPISKRARMSPSMGTFRRATQRFRIVSISVLLGACSASPVLMVTEQGVDDVHRPVCVVYSDGRVFLGRSDDGSVLIKYRVGWMDKDSVRSLWRSVGRAEFHQLHGIPSHYSRALAVRRGNRLRSVQADETDIDQVISKIKASVNAMRPWRVQTIAVALYGEPGKAIPPSEMGETTIWPERWPQMPVGRANPSMVSLPRSEPHSRIIGNTSGRFSRPRCSEAPIRGLPRVGGRPHPR